MFLLLTVYAIFSFLSQCASSSLQPPLYVRDWLKGIDPKFREKCEAMVLGEPKTFSQGWQDWVIYHNYFKQERHMGRGVYVDVGTNGPEAISNTLFFDKCLGWKGLCIEPQSTYHSEILKTRSCTLIPDCVLGDIASVKFIGNGGGGAVEVTNGGDTKCLAFLDVLQSNNITKIDFMSIDIERSEASVLRCFPFDKVEIDIILLETDKWHLREVDLFFHRHGYSNDETFLNSVSGTEGQNYYIDNLYVKRKMHTYPPVENFVCSDDDHESMLSWCAKWQTWKSDVFEWGECKPFSPA